MTAGPGGGTEGCCCCCAEGVADVLLVGLEADVDPGEVVVRVARRGAALVLPEARHAHHEVVPPCGALEDQGAPGVALAGLGAVTARADVVLLDGRLGVPIGLCIPPGAQRAPSRAAWTQQEGGKGGGGWTQGIIGTGRR